MLFRFSFLEMLSTSVGNTGYNQTQLNAIQEEILRLRRRISLLESEGEYTHFAYPSQFSEYLKLRDIVNGVITVANISFDGNMEGFVVPSGCTGLKFVMCIVKDMSRFFKNQVISKSIDLTGMDMRSCTSLYMAFENCTSSLVNLTPTNGPRSLINFALAFYKSNIQVLNMSNILSTSTIDLQYSLASSQFTEINIDNSNCLGINFNAHAMFYSNPKLTSLSTTSLTSNSGSITSYWDSIYPINMESMFQSLGKLETLDISNILEAYCLSIGAFVLGCYSLKTIVVNRNLIHTKTFKNRDRKSNELITKSDSEISGDSPHEYTGDSSSLALDWENKAYKFWTNGSKKYYQLAAYLTFDSRRDYYNPNYGPRTYHHYETEKEIKSFTVDVNKFTISLE